MSAPDTMMPLVSAPWLKADGNPLSVRALPGLRFEVIQGLECSYPGILSPTMKTLLSTCCGLAGTELGCIDFTGCWFLEEPCAVFRPALTLAVGDADRRWIAEVGTQDLPGPVWCVFPDPEVAVYVCDDLAAFVATLREHTSQGEMHAWLQGLTAEARTVWSQRHALAMRPHEAYADQAIRGWLLGLPFDAYVYDLRAPGTARGWPYGVAGPSGRLYRCGRLPVFAVAGLPAEGWRAPYPRPRAACTPEMPASAELSFAIETPQSCRQRRSNPEDPARWPLSRRTSGRPRRLPHSGRSNRRDGVTPMRMKDVRGLRRIALWTLMALMLCALAPEAVASGLIPSMPSLGATATALSLTLITVVSANQK
jgi:hypothetical protein